ncbi:alpha/beta hydrolase [Formosa sp. 4Alg 33]|uniref:alpha/beta hydrolase n=1 Tax=Formosa sp. 4Alg 33 TaxID=3382189 RepID=UPI003D9C4F61
MSINNYLLLTFLVCSPLLYSQQNKGIDTSYTINSAFRKVIKTYPNASIVLNSGGKNVQHLPDVLYKKIEERNLLLDAFISKTSTISPVIILVHGGGWKSGNRTLLNPLAEFIAENGFNSFTIDYSLAPKHKFPEAVLDIFDAIDFIKSQASTYNINPNKIVLLGSSAGGQLASLVATSAHSSIFQKDTISIQGLINIDGLLAFSHPKSEEGVLASSWLGETEKADPELWKRASALTYVDEFSPPTLFIPSDFDRFQAGREEMVSILNAHHIYSDVVPIHEAPHTFWLFNPWFIEVSNSIVQFLTYNIK